jgi:hypothetical protein
MGPGVLLRDSSPRRVPRFLTSGSARRRTDADGTVARRPHRLLVSLRVPREHLGSGKARASGARPTACLRRRSAGRGRTSGHTRAAHHLKQCSRADQPEPILIVVHDLRSPLRGKHWGPCTSSSWRCPRRRFSMESSGRTQVVPPGSIMANHNGPSAVRAVEGNLSGLSRRLKTGANVLDAQTGAPPQGLSADLNRRCRLTEAHQPRS